MWVKHHQAFCQICGRTTSHATHYVQLDERGPLTADVRCVEHKREVLRESGQEPSRESMIPPQPGLRLQIMQRQGTAPSRRA